MSLAELYPSISTSKNPLGQLQNFLLHFPASIILVRETAGAGVIVVTTLAGSGAGEVTVMVDSGSELQVLAARDGGTEEAEISGGTGVGGTLGGVLDHNHCPSRLRSPGAMI